MKRALPILAVLVLIAGISACSSPSLAPTAAPTSAVGPTGAPLAVLTAGNLADMGKDVYSSSCAACHGDKGQGGGGPKLVGAGNALGKYGDAQAVLTFISRNMPKTNPGGLNADQYLRVLAFVLVQNNLVNAAAPLDSTRLSAISAK